jgi:hypothetical protein
MGPGPVGGFELPPYVQSRGRLGFSPGSHRGRHVIDGGHRGSCGWPAGSARWWPAVAAH